MFKLKTKIMNKKKAQHIVEFALVVPIFIIMFSFILPQAANIYNQFQIPHLFMGAVSAAIENQPTDETSIEYNFANEIERRMNGRVTAYVVEAEQNAYIGGAATQEYPMLFGIRGKSYFNALVTINKAYVEPTVLNISGSTLKNNFAAYHAPNPAQAQSSATPQNSNLQTQSFMGGFNR